MKEVRVKCGTTGGYAKHLRLKEVTCDACREAHRNRLKQYYKTNYHRVYANTRKWTLANKDRVRAMKRISDAKKRAKQANVYREPYTEKEVLDLYGIICHICSIEIDLNATRFCGKEGWEMGLHIDHVIPLSKGGPDILENVRPSHAICNMRKGNRG